MSWYLKVVLGYREWEIILGSPSFCILPNIILWIAPMAILPMVFLRHTELLKLNMIGTNTNVVPIPGRHCRHSNDPIHLKR